MKKCITLLAFAMVCFTMSAQNYQFDLTALPFTNGGAITYDAPTKTLTWTGGGTGAMGWGAEGGSTVLVDATNYTYLTFILASVTNPNTGNCASCKVYYTDGSAESTSVQPLSTRTIFNYTLKSDSKAGIAGVEFRLFNGANNATTTVTIEDIFLSSTLASVRNTESSSLKTYPNPFNNNVAVESAENIKSIGIYSVNGQKVKGVTVNSTKANIGTSDLSKGVYVLKIETDNGVQTVSVVK